MHKFLAREEPFYPSEIQIKLNREKEFLPEIRNKDKNTKKLTFERVAPCLHAVVPSPTPTCEKRSRNTRKDRAQ